MTKQEIPSELTCSQMAPVVDFAYYRADLYRDLLSLFFASLRLCVIFSASAVAARPLYDLCVLVVKIKVAG
jgi:hypothetical protein